MVYAYRTDTGKVRTNNEDFIAVPEEGIIEGHGSFRTGELGWLFVLCDGMGGANAGEVASSMAGSILLGDYYSLEKKPDDPGFFLTEKILEINSRILRRGLRMPDCYGMGTTLVSLLVDGNDAYINSVGDSRVYRLKGQTLEQVTEDQSLVWEFYKSGRMTKEEIRNHPRNNILTCALGTEQEMMLTSIESYRLGIENGDIFLLCSDGLSDLLSDSDIGQILLADDSPDRTADRLVDTANKRGGRDNVSVVVVSF